MTGQNRQVTLGEIARVQTGPFGSQLHASDYSVDGIPVVMPQNIGDNRIDPTDISRTTPEHVERLARHKLALGDVVYSRRGDIERRALIRQGEVGWLCGTGCLLVRPDQEQVDPEWLSYWLGTTHVREFLVRSAVGATMLNLNTGILASVPVDLPSLHEQRLTAGLLCSLDHKIELNRQTNQTLEEMARAIFRSWFVDFDPVRVKAAGGDPVKELGLSPEVAALFPDSFEDSGLGEIPEGWETRPLDSLGTFLNGLALQKYPLEPGESGQPAIKIAELRRGVTEASDQVSRDVPADYLVNDGDLLFSWSGSLMSKVWTGGPGALNQHLFKVSSAELPQWLLYWWIQHHLPEFQAVASSKATTMGHIQRSHLRQALCVVPPRAVLEAANSCIAPLHQLRIDNELEARSLSDLRNYLLPRLLSGAVVVDPGEASP